MFLILLTCTLTLNLFAYVKKAEPESRSTRHSIKLREGVLAYTATVGTFVVKNTKGIPWARIGYTCYVKEPADPARPVTYAFNGGPSVSAVDLHLGVLGPRRLVFADAENTLPPYRLVDNQETLLTCSDLVLIDPVGTGFSKALEPAKNQDFWTVDTDIESVALFIDQFAEARGWLNTPTFLVGESYGTLRAAGVADYLGPTFLKGVILVSVAMDQGIESFAPGEEQAFPLFLPSYTAVAAYHHALPTEPKNLEALLEECRAFAMGPYATALFKGDRLSDPELEQLAQGMNALTGLSVPYLKAARLRVSPKAFRQELLRARGLTLGRLDARYTGPNLNPLAEQAPWDPFGVAIAPAYDVAWRMYLKDELGFGQGETYLRSPQDPGSSWGYHHRINGNTQAIVNTTVDLSHAMLFNSRLKVLTLCGLYDVGTPFFAAEYTMNHLNLLPASQDRVSIKHYQAGHMMYLCEPERKQMMRDVEAFIQASNPPRAEDVQAKH